mmetsp:Transcript_14068/g.30172  ORF Transcript_14068/g.30172 Transcript_14068/m.30172 type:complete len:891 (+) Transcript_14068:310-2982(+)
MSSEAGNATDSPGFEDYVEQTTDTGYIPVLVVLLAGLISQLVVLPMLVVCGRRSDKRRRRKTEAESSKAQPVLHVAVRARSVGVGTFCYAEEPDAAVIHTSEGKVCDEEGGYESVELSPAAIICSGASMDAAGRDSDCANAQMEVITDTLGWLRDRMRMLFYEDNGSRSLMGAGNSSINPSMFDAPAPNRYRRKKRIEKGIADEARFSVLHHRQPAPVPEFEPQGGKHMCRVLLLLLNTTEKIFELLQVEYSVETATVDCLLDQIKVHAADSTLRRQNYLGLIRLRDERKLTDANIRAMLFYHSTGNEDDILIPVTEDSMSCHECRMVAKTILKTSNVIAFLDRDVTLASTEQAMNLPMNSQQDNDDDSSASPKKCCCLGSLSDSLNNLVNIFKCDDESKRILRLAVPFTFSGLVEEVLEIISLSIISLNLGTDALSAYILVETLIEITSEFAGGAIDGQAPLVSHALGAGNNKLAGQYVQLCTILYVAIQLLFVLLWSTFTYDIILLMGFNSTVAQMAQEYGRLAVWCDVIGGISEAYSDFFEVAGRELFVAFVGNVEALVEFAALAIAILIFNGSLISVAIIEIVNSVLFFVFTVAYTFWKGWAQPFQPGIFGSFSLRNRFAVKQAIKTATPLAFGSVLIYGEWEISTIFAAYLGPAEATAWAVLGSLSDVFEASTEGISDAAEIRVAYQCGKNHPQRAKISSYKSILMGIIFSIFVSSVTLILHNDIPRWLTSDPTLQRMIAENIPLMAIDNMIMTSGSLCWTLVGAQGRYRLATIVFALSSWFVTIPLAAVSVYVLFLDLKGLLASFSIGFLFAATALSYILLRSDWAKISQHIQEKNALMGEVDSSDDDENSVSSSSSSSSSSSVSSSSSGNSLSTTSSPTSTDE